MKKLMIMACAVATLAACQKNAEPVVAPGRVQVEPVITKATEVNFEEGDKVGLTMVVENATEKYAENACFTFASNVFSGDLDWYADIYTKSDFYAYYPYSAAGVPTSYCTKYDQSEGIGVADFMVASKTGVLPTSNAVTMVFKHMMTKLVVNVDNESGAEIKSIGIDGTPRATGLDLVNMTLTEFDGNLTAEVPDPITAYEAVAGKTWQAIVIPHSNAMSIVVTLSNKKVITQPLAAMTLKSGGQYTINARVLPDELTLTASGEIQNWTEEGEIGFEGGSTAEDLPVTFNEYDGYFEYDGVEYKTVTLSNGQTWMAEPLRFIPRGKTVSSDPSDGNGIWYSYKVTDGVPAALTDDDSVEKLGYLYDFSAAFGAQITVDNYADFDGAQGICPAGWHIPTRADFAGTFGNASKTMTEEVLVDATAPFYEADYESGSVPKANAAGFNFTFSGAVINGAYNKLVVDESVCSVEEYYGANRMSYIIGSTPYQLKTNDDGSLKSLQYFAVMTTFTSKFQTGKLSAAYCGYNYAGQVRCVKNK